MMEAVRTSETSVDNHFTRQYIPEDTPEHHTWGFVTALTTARYRSLCRASRIQSTPPKPIALRSFMIPSSHLNLGLPSGLFPSGFPTKTLYKCFPELLPSEYSNALFMRQIEWYYCLEQHLLIYFLLEATDVPPFVLSRCLSCWLILVLYFRALMCRISTQCNILYST
jgi:hypothetical protein